MGDKEQEVLTKETVITMRGGNQIVIPGHVFWSEFEGSEMYHSDTRQGKASIRTKYIAAIQHQTWDEDGYLVLTGEKMARNNAP